MELMEAIRTTRSMRRLKSDPIPDEDIRAILAAAIRAPSGSNQQGWSFIVVRDGGIKAQLGALYRDAAYALFGGGYGERPDATLEEQRQTRRLVSSVLHLADHFGEAPVLIAACLALGRPLAEMRPDQAITRGASIYPAVQNLMLAARERGIGSTLTTLHRSKNDEVRRILSLPPDIEALAIVPLGYPEGRWGEAPRRPLDEIVFRDRFGERL